MGGLNLNLVVGRLGEGDGYGGGGEPRGVCRGVLPS